MGAISGETSIGLTTTQDENTKTLFL